MSTLAEMQARPFGWSLYRDGQQVAVCHLFPDAATAKAAALKIAQPGDFFHVHYRAWGFQRFAVLKTATAEPQEV